MRLTALFIVFLSVSACKSDKEKAIVGKWNADNLVECDDVVPIVANLVNIEFKSDDQYIFNSTLNIHEEGTYKIKKNHLFLQDKIRDKAVEKIVLITKLTSDSLVLEMNFKGKEQWLTFVKENNSTPKLDKVDGTKDSVIASTTVNNNNNNNNNKPDISTAIASGASTAKEDIKPTKSEEKPKVEPVKEVKKEEPKVEKKPEPKPLSKLEAYRKREAQRQEEEADRKNEEKKRHDAYLKREAQRKKEEAERKKRLKK